MLNYVTLFTLSLLYTTTLLKAVTPPELTDQNVEIELTSSHKVNISSPSHKEGKKPFFKLKVTYDEDEKTLVIQKAKGINNLRITARDGKVIFPNKEIYLNSLTTISNNEVINNGYLNIESKFDFKCSQLINDGEMEASEISIDTSEIPSRKALIKNFGHMKVDSVYTQTGLDATLKNTEESTFTLTGNGNSELNFQKVVNYGIIKSLKGSFSFVGQDKEGHKRKSHSFVQLKNSGQMPAENGFQFHSEGPKFHIATAKTPQEFANQKMRLVRLSQKEGKSQENIKCIKEAIEILEKVEKKLHRANIQASSSQIITVNPLKVIRLKATYNRLTEKF